MFSSFAILFTGLMNGQQPPQIDTPLPLCYVEDSGGWPAARLASTSKIHSTGRIYGSE